MECVGAQASRGLVRSALALRTSLLEEETKGSRVRHPAEASLEQPAPSSPAADHKPVTKHR